MTFFFFRNKNNNINIDIINKTSKINIIPKNNNLLLVLSTNICFTVVFWINEILILCSFIYLN